MGTILRNATPEEERVAQNLLGLGIQRAGRVTGEIIRKLREQFYRDAGLFVTDHGTIRDLLPKSKQSALMPFKPPANDHGRLIFWGGPLPIVYLSQPYGISHTDIKQIIAFSEKWNLEVDINPAQALWYPGRTCAIAYSVPGTTYGTPWENIP